MEKIQLSLLLKIVGIGSASGLLYQNNSIIAIGDNSSYLYEYQIESSKLNRYSLAENASENIPKAFKPDFEAITQYQDSIYIFGSGSTENRNFMIQVDAKSKEVIKSQEIDDLYLTMQSFGEISADDFNIEGVIRNDENWFFFNRGNGKNGKNIIFTVNGKNLTNEFQIIANEYKLPKIKGVRTGFTDAILVDDKIYFLASAENSDSTYHDGEVLGTVIGRIDLKKMKIDFTKKISDSHKFEGISLYKKSSKNIEFLLCEDNDTEILEADIYRLEVDIKQ